MSIFKRLPWISLVLALLTYCSLGWVISKTYMSTTALGITALAVLILVFVLTTPWVNLTNYSNKFFKSNSRTFAVTVFGAFLLFLIIARFRLFLDTLVIISATILVRIDFQSAGLKQTHAFGIMSIISLSGLATGILIHRVFG